MINNLKEIKKEIKRFRDTLNLAIKRSEDNKGYISSYDNKWTDVGGVSGTKEMGAVKRAALDLKRCLTKNLNYGN